MQPKIITMYDRPFPNLHKARGPSCFEYAPNRNKRLILREAVLTVRLLKSGFFKVFIGNKLRKWSQERSGVRKEVESGKKWSQERKEEEEKRGRWPL